eukprot:scaffold25789_cov101-Isochrysis_galbana.AAC.5
MSALVRICLDFPSSGLWMSFLTEWRYFGWVVKMTLARSGHGVDVAWGGYSGSHHHEIQCLVLVRKQQATGASGSIKHTQKAQKTPPRGQSSQTHDTTHSYSLQLRANATSITSSYRQR